MVQGGDFVNVSTFYNWIALNDRNDIILWLYFPCHPDIILTRSF